jgi:hypothetical protein
MGLDSVVDIATRFGIDGPGFESLWEWGETRVSALVQTEPGSLPTLLYSVCWCSPEVKAADPWRYPPTRVYCRVQSKSRTVC